MFPFGLKIVFLVTSVTGLISCWIVLLLYSKGVNSYWGPMVYAVACTLLHGIFHISIVWELDPEQFPGPFCFVQAIVLDYSTFLLTGTCSALSFTISLCILRPGSWGIFPKGPLGWRNVYIVPIVAFPVFATAAVIVVSFVFDAVQPNDILFCGASRPLWIRLLGYAGVPLLMLVPCDVLFAIALHRAWVVRRSSLPHFEAEMTPSTLPKREDISLQRSSTASTGTASRGSSSLFRSVSNVLWRVVLFHCAFNLIILLACLSTVLNILTNSTPEIFGTHHVAFLLAAWGPAIVFGNSSSVRRPIGGLLSALPLTCWALIRKSRNDSSSG